MITLVFRLRKIALRNVTLLRTKRENMEQTNQ